jgi:hypothetical protein
MSFVSVMDTVCVALTDAGDPDDLVPEHVVDREVVQRLIVEIAEPPTSRRVTDPPLPLRGVPRYASVRGPAIDFQFHLAPAATRSRVN